jgi:hypothetical protein
MRKFLRMFNAGDIPAVISYLAIPYNLNEFKAPDGTKGMFSYKSS